MKHKRMIGVLSLVFYLATLVSISVHAADDRIDVVKDAVGRSICRQVYWQNERYPLGKSVSIEVKIEGERFYVWIEDSIVDRTKTVSHFYQGRIRNGKGAITFVTGHNTASNHTPPPHFFDERRKFEQNSIREKMRIPDECAQHFSSSSPEKAKMVETVVNTMQRQLSSYRRVGIENYPQKLSITIADFDVDYPQTYVLVDLPSGQVEMNIVTLHDPDNWDTDKYERDGAYPLVNRRIGPEHKGLIGKIRRNGIVREIMLVP